MGLRTDTWKRLDCGDHVREVDGRHVGRVELIDGVTVKVRWFETRWVSYFDLGEIVRLPKGERE